MLFLNFLLYNNISRKRIYKYTYIKEYNLLETGI